MKELLLQYAKYNVWANKLMIGVLNKLSDAQIDADIASSFPSIKKTVSHVWSAEDIWLQRLNLAEQPVWAESVFEGSFDDMLNNWQKTSKDLQQFVEKQFNDEAFLHVMQYYNLQKQSIKLPVNVGLMQVFNHGTYHRGQLITMLRQVGVAKLPATDFFRFTMSK